MGDRLVSNPRLPDSFKAVIKEAVILEVGDQIKGTSIHVELAKGSVLVIIKISEPTTDEWKSSSKLMDSIATKVLGIPGINAAKSGLVVVKKAGPEEEIEKEGVASTKSETGEREQFGKSTDKKEITDENAEHMKQNRDAGSDNATSSKKKTAKETKETAKSGKGTKEVP